MKPHYLLSLLFLIMFTAAYGQKQNVYKTSVTRIQKKTWDNSIKLSTGDFFIRGSGHSQTPLTQIGGCYERKVFKNWYAGLGFYKWNSMDDVTATSYSSFRVTEIPGYLSTEIGTLQYRESYKMLDFYGFYKWHLRDRHSLNTGLGLSYNWGANIYLRWYSRNYGPGIQDATGGTEYRYVEYWGAITYVSYDYLVWKNRVCVGGEYRTRFYSGRNNLQHDIGVHVGVNF